MRRATGGRVGDGVDTPHPAPDGGWPVLSWAHGTTGVSDICAPSNDTADGPAHDYLGGVDAVLDRYVADGYVVVQTDYVGMGTPGGHPYMDGGTEANAVVDIVRASREIDDSISNQWYAMGHSQGGHATLFTRGSGERACTRTRSARRGRDCPGQRDECDAAVPGVRWTPRWPRHWPSCR